MINFDILQNYFLKAKEYPISQAVAVASVSYLGFKISSSFPKETNPYLNYFGKTLSTTAVIGILHFSGLLSEKFFVDRIGFKLFTLGPVVCSTSLKNLQDIFSTLI